jgi:hypothetical protein
VEAASRVTETSVSDHVSEEDRRAAGGDAARWPGDDARGPARARDPALGDEALATYGLSEEELDAWQEAVDRHGEAALKATALQRYRQP